MPQQDTATNSTPSDYVKQAHLSARQTVKRAKQLLRSEGKRVAADAVGEGIQELTKLLSLTHHLPETSPRPMAFSAAAVVGALARVAAGPAFVGAAGTYLTGRALRASDRWANSARPVRPRLADAETSERRAAMAYILHWTEKLREARHSLQ